MRLPERLRKKNLATDDERFCNSHALPKFSFEGSDRPLVGTECFFHQWSEDAETAYTPGFHAIDNALKLEQDIFVRI